MKCLEDSNTIEISFEDDGIGMPPAVLTVPLLDFGTSFWTTELAALLYPGLQSDSQFRPAGRYGIGFFSAFMFSDRVAVFSRPFSKGKDDLFALIFKNGLSGRAELRPYDRLLDGQIEERASTVLKARVPIDKMFTSLEPPFSKSGRNIENLYELAHLFLSKLCFALDVVVKFEMKDGTFVQINEPFYADWSNEAFVTNLEKTFMDGKSLPLKLAKCVEPLVNDDGQLCGRACVSIGSTSRGSIYVIDGFARIPRAGYVIGRTRIGVSEQTPNVASRGDGTLIATRSAFNRWASKQLDHIVMDRNNYSSRELYFAAAHLSQYDVDVLPIVHCYVRDRRFVPLVECVDLFKKKKLIFIVQDNLGNATEQLQLSSVSNACRAISEDLGELVECENFVQHYIGSSVFERLSGDLSDAAANNVLSCFLRLLNENSTSYSVSFQPKAQIGRYSGFSTNWIEDGEIVYSDAVIVSLQPSKRRKRSS
jgi:hypothetical protein